MKTELKVLIFIEALDHYYFFLRIKKSLDKLNYKTVFITLKFSLFLKLKRNGFDCHLIRNSNYQNDEIPDLSVSLEFKAGYLDEFECRSMYLSVCRTIKNIHDDKNITYIFIFGGFSVSAIAQRQFADVNKIPVLYFELSNIPHKIFIDPIGTNANSSISNDYSLLEKYNVSNHDYEVWKQHYIETKASQKDIPQSEKSKSINIGYFLDWLGFTFFKIPRGANRGILSQFKNKVMIRFFNLKPDNSATENLKYIFYPMQVSSDSQIVINSKFTNITAIEYAAAEANRKNLKLVVKLHPAEKNYNEIRKTKKLKSKFQFIISDKNAFLLIRDAEEIITINSTAGLESLILGKKVTVLGNSFYGKFTPDNLKQYLLGFLIDIDFFSSEPVSEIQMGKILSRINLRESPEKSS